MIDITVLIPTGTKHIDLVHGAHDGCLYAEPKIVYDCGLGKSKILNIHIQQIKTKYIAFLDADDWNLPNRFQDLSEDFDLLYSDCLEIFKNRSVKYCKSRDFNFEELKKKNYIPFSTAIVKTEIAKKLNFCSEIEGKDDWLYWLKFSLISKKIIYRPYPTVCRRMWTGYFTPSLNIYFIRKLIRIYQQRKVRRIIDENF